jgi:TRAP transporter TAXI family solute receptor
MTADDGRNVLEPGIASPDGSSDRKGQTYNAAIVMTLSTSRMLGQNRLMCLAMMAALATSCGSAADGPQKQRVTLRVTAGLLPAGGVASLFAEALARSFDETSSEFRVQVRPTTGSVANVEAIQRGEADVSQAAADVAYQAFNGRLDTNVGPFDRLRAIAVLELTPVQLIARADAPIRSVADLRGRRISAGPQGAGTALTARLILQAFGIDPSAVRIESMPFSDAGVLLRKGDLDAMFQNAVQRPESVEQALSTGASLIPITGGMVDRLRHEYPFLRLTIMPRDPSGRVRGIPTIGVDNLLLCHRDLGEALVHDITRRLFKILPSLSLARGLDFADLDQAPATPIPLHEGAARYYREQELLR